MEKVDLTKQFAFRLRESMIAAGFNSSRSPSGVDIQKLAEITGYSLQICRKYLKGEALPEPAKLSELATKLSVSPGWLLFGNADDTNTFSPEIITIQKKLLHYIFLRSAELYNEHFLKEDIALFLVELAVDLSQITADEAQAKKIIDLALSSVRHFNQPQGK